VVMCLNQLGPLIHHQIGNHSCLSLQEPQHVGTVVSERHKHGCSEVQYGPESLPLSIQSMFLLAAHERLGVV
jgi:hypothetical protein